MFEPGNRANANGFSPNTETTETTPSVCKALTFAALEKLAMLLR